MPKLLRPICRFVTILACALAAQTLASAETQWPRFRGPDGLGQCRDGGMPVRWGPGDVAWRTELPGEGHSSPCIWGERIFLTTARKTGADRVERSVLAVDRASGRVLWSRVASVGGAEQVHRLNGFATPTCATDGRHVVAYFGRGGIHCYDVEGNKLWSRDLGTFPGPWGIGASPIILGDRVIQNCDAEGESYLVAFDLRTGEPAWRTSRGSLPRGGWNTPFVIDVDGRRELILNGQHGIRGYDPQTGKERWFCKSFNGRGTPVPAFGHGMLFVVSGLPGDIYAVRPGGTGDVTGTRMAWHTPRRGGRDISSPIVVGDYLMVVNMAGVGICYDAKTGRELWRERLEGAYSASPVAAGGLVYIQNEAGATLVIKPGDKLDVVARNKIAAGDGEVFRASLAPSKGQVFCRSNRALYCIGKRTGK